MSCSHCRQQTTVSRVADIDGTQLWLCSQCADTQRQFVAAATSPSSASSRNNSTQMPRSGSIERRHTVATASLGGNGSGGGQNRAAFFSNALGGSQGIQRLGQPRPPPQPSSGGEQAWNRDEAMAMLEQHEWNRANANSANAMADQLNARYGPMSPSGSGGGGGGDSGGGRSPTAAGNRPPAMSPSGGSDVGGRNGHPVNCRCGLCNRNWAVES